MNEKSVLVIGSGFMGSGIAQVCAQAGCQVSLTDASAEARTRALDIIAGSVAKLHKKGLVADDPNEVMGRITPCDDMSPAKDAALVIEVVPEMLDLKLEIFAKLDELADPAAILASNTSSIPITSLAAATKHPERVIGLHFFGPVPLMPLVEVVRGEKTSDDVMERGVAFCKSIGKTPVRVQKDIPGFVMNRIFAAAFSEAVKLVDDGVVTPWETDIGMKLGYGWGAGPFEIADNAGLDVHMLVNEFFKSVGEQRIKEHSDLVRRMVAEGKLGRKVGKGFYDYDENGKRIMPK